MSARPRPAGRRRVAGILLLPLLIAVQVLAAPSLAAERPRVGLALSGGGARGFSHVGVLRALERLRIPVDCIAGTSAGSAVGAAYAMGQDPAAIEARLRAGDWGGRMFSDQPSREELPYMNKARVGGDPAGITFGVASDGLRGSSGIYAGQQIELFLHGLLGISSELASFDELPIPYRAIATDLVDGRMVVQDRGSLVHAVRASMAVPSAFAPVKVGQRLLVDGGLTQNLPVAAVRELCADVVIAVDIGSPLLKADELQSLFGVGLQMVSILMERNVAESLSLLGREDVLIVPDLNQVSAVDFAHGVDGIPAGEAATLAAAPALSRLALSEADYARWQAQRQARQLQPPLVTRVEVAPTRFVNPEYFALQGVEAGRAPGSIDVPGLHRRIQRWTGSGDFTSVAYTVRPTPAGHVLWIDAQEKPWGPDYLQVGLAGQADSRGNADFSVQGALRKTWMNSWGAEWVTVARFGRAREVETRWFQPLGTGSAWFLEPRVNSSTTPRRVFADDRPLGEFSVTRHKLEFRMGAQGPQGLAALGLVMARIETEPSLGFPGVGSARARINGINASLVYDRLDDIDFPRQGSMLRVDSFSASRALGAETSYTRHELEAATAHSVGEHALRLRARWARVQAEGTGLRDVVSVGGFLDLSGYHTGQFIGSGVTLASITWFRRLLPLPQPFGSGLFAGVSLEAARVQAPVGSASAHLDRLGGAVFLGASTALGPAYLGVGLGQGGNRALYLLLGRP